MAIQPLTRPKMTVAEFLALPEDDSSPVKYELEFGELVEVTRPLWDHNEFIQELASYLRAYLRPRRLGRVSGDVLVVLDEVAGVVLAPDIVVLLAEHLDRLREGRVYGPPDLVVEVLSPTTALRDMGVKKRLYHTYGVPWYWLIDLERRVIEEYHWTPDGYLLTQVVLPGEVFRPKLFPDLTIDLRVLLGETEEATEPPQPKRRKSRR
ncbi:MAG: hypothetical protein PVTTEEND_001122 [Candidatus Fervidibacter sp.]